MPATRSLLCQGAAGLKREPCLLPAPRPETPGARLGSREGADCRGGRCIRRSEKKASCVGWVVREGPELRGRKLASDVKGLDR